MVTLCPDFRVENNKLPINKIYFPPLEWKIAILCLLNIVAYLSSCDNFEKSEVNYLSFEIKIVYVTGLENNAINSGSLSRSALPHALNSALINCILSAPVIIYY